MLVPTCVSLYPLRCPSHRMKRTREMSVREAMGREWVRLTPSKGEREGGERGEVSGSTERAVQSNKGLSVGKVVQESCS